MKKSFNFFINLWKNIIKQSKTVIVLNVLGITMILVTGIISLFDTNLFIGFFLFLTFFTFMFVFVDDRNLIRSDELSYVFFLIITPPFLFVFLIYSLNELIWMIVGFKKNKVKIIGDYPNGRWSRYEYDSHDNLIYYKDSKGVWTKYEYDSKNRLIYVENYTGYWCKYTNGTMIDHGYKDTFPTPEQIKQYVENGK